MSMKVVTDWWTHFYSINWNQFFFLHLQTLLDHISDNKSHKEIISDIKELALKTNIPEHEIIGLVSILFKLMKVAVVMFMRFRFQ